MVIPNRYDRIKYTAHDKERKCPEEQDPSDARSDFERDRARVIHSAAFRRLQGKTQVFTSGEGDFYRTRLAHSLEVAQIAKGLALRLGAHPELVEAAALLHDIGHPPFGHSGEDELKTLMSNYGGFEANAQNVRLITELEKKSTKYKGLNLTRAVIDAQLKYKNGPGENERKFIYADDLDLAKWAGGDAQTAAGCTDPMEKSFECQIMDQADDIAYAVHDLEDAVRARYIDALTFSRPNSRIARAIDDVQNSPDANGMYVRPIYNQLVSVLRYYNPTLRIDANETMLEYTREYRKEMTTRLIGRYILAAERRPVPNRRFSKESSRYLYKVEMDRTLKIEIELIKKIAWHVVIGSPQVMVLENKGKRIVRSLFQKYLGDYRFLPDDWQQGLSKYTDEAEIARRVSDYVSGMTDDYAQKTYAKFFLPNHGSIYEVI